MGTWTVASAVSDLHEHLVRLALGYLQPPNISNKELSCESACMNPHQHRYLACSDLHHLELGRGICTCPSAVLGVAALSTVCSQ
jgi:hypothetical protein